MVYLKTLYSVYRLQRNGRKSEKEIRKIQTDKLNRILRFAYNHSAYYRKTFQQAGISEQDIGRLSLCDFPSINKATFMEHFDELITVKGIHQDDLRAFDNTQIGMRNLFQNRYHIVHSSGSTGKPGYFLYDNKAWNTMLCGIIRGALWDLSVPQILRYLRSEPRIVYIAATDGRYGGAMAVGDGISGMKAKQLFLDIKTPLAEWKQKISEFQPNMIIGYPSAIKILAEIVEQTDMKVDIFRVVTCGEPLGANMRQFLEHTFHTLVVNLYGTSESLALGVEVSDEEGMYLFDDLNVVEIIDGETYITSLYNYAQPLIRYKLSDRLLRRERDSRYPFEKIGNIAGRNEDVMWFEDRSGGKEFLHPLGIEGFCIEGMIDYQFRQCNCQSFEIAVEVADYADKSMVCQAMEANMKNVLQKKHLEHLQFSVKIVRQILPDKRTGKKQLIVQQEGD